MKPRNVRIVFKRLERDDEYAARLRASGVGVPSCSSEGAKLDEYGEARDLPRRIVEDVQP